MKWCHEFFEGRTDVHDEQRSSRPSVISDDLLQIIKGEIRAIQCRMIKRVVSHLSQSVYDQNL
jgi:hypothetical protein